MKNIAIFASGNGSNAENIIRYFQNTEDIQVVLVSSNVTDSGAIKRAKKHNIPTLIFNKLELNEGVVLEVLKSKKISLIILAGFLLKIPKNLIKNYLNKIINIHPSLLPLYGGKGMYGMNVHKKVFESKDKETGITIHFVNEIYDGGSIIFQAKCLLPNKMTPKLIQRKVHELEIKFFPLIIEKLLNG